MVAGSGLMLALLATQPVSAATKKKEAKQPGTVQQSSKSKWQPGINCRTGGGGRGPQGILPKCPRGTY
jgi:hypothetical protein